MGMPLRKEEEQEIKPPNGNSLIVIIKNACRLVWAETADSR